MNTVNAFLDRFTPISGLRYFFNFIFIIGFMFTWISAIIFGIENLSILKAGQPSLLLPLFMIGTIAPLNLLMLFLIYLNVLKRARDIKQDKLPFDEKIFFLLIIFVPVISQILLLAFILAPQKWDKYEKILIYKNNKDMKV